MGTLSLYVSDDLEQKIRKAAAEDKRTISNWLNVALEEYFDELNKTNGKTDGSEEE